MELCEGGDSADWFFLAMAHWRLDAKDESRQWFDKAVAWMEQHSPDDEELKRFRAEAAELLGVADQGGESNSPRSAPVRPPIVPPDADAH
jgi:hypothetical protein